MKKLNIFLVILLMVTLVQTPIISVAKSSSSSVKKGVSTKVLSVSKKKIELKITNNTNTYITFGEEFVLKKYTKGKWKKVQFKKGIAFKEIAHVIESGGSVTKKVVWKHCFDKNLSKGKYKIIYTNSKVKATFKIK